MRKIFVILVLALCMFVPKAYGQNHDEYSPAATNYYNSGIAHYQAREYSAAIVAFQRAIEVEPDFTDAYFNLAAVYEYLGDSEKAIQTYAKLLRIKPNDYDATFEMAKSYYKKSNYKIAMKYLTDIPPTYSRYSEVNAFKVKTADAIRFHDEAQTLPKVAAPTIAKKATIGKFTSPTGITSDSAANLYIANFTNNYISKITPDKKCIKFAQSPLIKGPIGLATDKNNDIYVANYGGNSVLKITPNGHVSTFVSNIHRPYYLYVKNDFLYVSEQATNTVIRYYLK